MRPDVNSVEASSYQANPSIKIEPLAETFGQVVVSENPTVVLNDLDRDYVIQLYSSSGAVLFRGFDVTLKAFENFTDRFTSKYIVNGSLTREPISVDGTTQTVNSGMQMIAPHSEMAYTPFRPEILWFYCQSPAAHGGETLVCDGLDVWSNLNSKLKQLFLSSRLTYRKRFNNQEHDLSSMALLWFGQAMDTSSMGETLANIPDTLFRVEDDGSFHLEYTVSAVQKPKHCDSLAFANSLIVEDRTCFFENGEIVPRDLRLEIFYEASKCSLLHKWQTGDVLMVDNTRIMHGRTPFRDAKRRILVRMGRETF